MKMIASLFLALFSLSAAAEELSVYSGDLVNLTEAVQVFSADAKIQAQVSAKKEANYKLYSPSGVLLNAGFGDEGPDYDVLVTLPYAKQVGEFDVDIGVISAIVRIHAFGKSVNLISPSKVLCPE